MSLNLVADYGSSSEEEAPDLEEKRKDETKVVVVKALRQIGGSTISVVKGEMLFWLDFFVGFAQGRAADKLLFLPF